VIESYRRILFMSALTVVDTPIRRGFFGAALASAGALAYREIAPYQQPTTNLLNIVVQYQVILTFIYVSLLLNNDGTNYNGVLADISEEAIAAVMVIVNLR